MLLNFWKLYIAYIYIINYIVYRHKFFEELILYINCKTHAELFKMKTQNTNETNTKFGTYLEPSPTALHHVKPSRRTQSTLNYIVHTHTHTRMRYIQNTHTHTYLHLHLKDEEDEKTAFLILIVVIICIT